MEETLKAANARIGEARAYFFPTIAITGTGGFRTSEFDQWFKWASRAFSIGPSITLPIFEGYTNVARLEIAESRYHQMLEQYRQTILNAFREVADLLVALQARGEQLASQHQEVQSAQEAQRACRHSLSQRTGDLLRCLGCGTNGPASRTDVGSNGTGPSYRYGGALQSRRRRLGKRTAV